MRQTFQKSAEGLKVVLWRKAPKPEPLVVKREVLTGIARAKVDEENKRKWAEACKERLVALGLAAVEGYRLTCQEAAERVLSYPEGKQLAEDAARFGLEVTPGALARWLVEAQSK